MNQDFRYRFRVRYNECDAQQVVFNARYADYADLAMTEFLRAMVGSHSVLLERGLDFQVVKLTLDWQNPAVFDDVVDISVRTIKLGRTSFVVEHSMMRASDETFLCRAEGVYVMVSTHSLNKTEIPGDLREKLEGGAAGGFVDQSGGLP